MNSSSAYDRYSLSNEGPKPIGPAETEHLGRVETNNFTWAKELTSSTPLPSPTETHPTADPSSALTGVVFGLIVFFLVFSIIRLIQTAIISRDIRRQIEAAMEMDVRPRRRNRSDSN